MSFPSSPSPTRDTTEREPERHSRKLERESLPLFTSVGEQP